MSLAGFMGGVGSFQRIQEFLMMETRTERRKFPFLRTSIGSASDLGCDTDKDSNASQKSRFSFERKDLGSSGTQAVVIENGQFGWDKTKQPEGCLQAINMTVPRGKVTMIVGPVGCGKSTLLKAILGEVPVMEGTVHLSSMRIALCDQTSWHVNSTVQQSIVGVSDFDQRWYVAVVRSCALDEDLRQLPQGDQTQIGSKGIALSGGQSQRIVRSPLVNPASDRFPLLIHRFAQALARAIYAQKDVVILDNCLSGLDGQTENRVWHSLLGREGLLRKCRSTVLIASSSGM